MAKILPWTLRAREPKPFPSIKVTPGLLAKALATRRKARASGEDGASLVKVFALLPLVVISEGFGPGSH